MSGFQLKDFASIVASEVNHARSVTDKITDFIPGSVARTLLEAPAVEIEELYMQFFLGLRDAIPVATFRSFGFDKLPAKRAFGYASVASATPLAADIEIPAGTVFSTAAGATYTSTAAVTWAAGAVTVRVPVQADVVGLVGNAAAGVITDCALFPPSSGYTVSNAEISNGADVETDAEREARFAEFVRALSRGTNDACIYAAGTSRVLDADGNIDQFVTRLGFIEIPGRMSIYAYSNRGLASAELLGAGQRILDGYRMEDGTRVPGYRPAGVRVELLAMVERAVPMTIQVEMLPGFDLTSAVEQDLTDTYGTQIRAVQAGETLLIEDLVTALLSVAGVSKVVSESTSNITCSANEALIPGTLTIAPL